MEDEGGEDEEAGTAFELKVSVCCLIGVHGIDLVFVQSVVVIGVEVIISTQPL